MRNVLPVMGLGALGLAGAVAAGAARAAELTGTVRDTDGAALAGVMITAGPARPQVGEVTVTVFTDAQGRYRLDTASADPATWTVRARALGLATQTLPADTAGAITLQAAANLADQVPASAWLQGLPDDDETRHALWICAGCHQLPSARMRRYAELTAGRNEADRIAAWHAMVQYMRVKTFDLGPEGSAWPGFPWEVKSDPSISGYDLEDEALIAAALGKHLPTDYAHLERYDPGAPLGVNARTVIREYQMPPQGFTREVGLSARSPYVWGAELNGNRLMRLDPRTGAVAELKVPFDQASGPHTIVDDRDGHLWVTSIENDLLMRLDPTSEQWTLYRDFGAGALIHDLAMDANFQVAFDAKGRLWATLIGQNRLGGLHPGTRETVAFDAPTPAGKSAIHTAIYGLVMDSARKRLWYAQLGGGVGSFNVETLKFETHIPFEMGEGPRRLAIDDQDRIYVPLMGSSEVFIYDTRAGRELARVKLPDRWAATYNVTWSNVIMRTKAPPRGSG